MILIGGQKVQANDTYPYLVIETTDGAKAYFPTSSLALNISGSTLKAGSNSFTLSNLSKMYFSKSDETITGIKSATDGTIDETAEIYDLNGKKVATGTSGKNNLPNGVYVVKTKNRTYKMIVK